MLVYSTVQTHNYYIYPRLLQVIYVSLFYSTNTWLSYQSQRSASHQYTFIQWQPSVGLMAHLVNKKRCNGITGHSCLRSGFMVIKDLMIVLLSGDTQKDSREKAVVFNPYNSSKDSKVSSDDTNYNENVLFYIFFFHSLKVLLYF